MKPVDQADIPLSAVKLFEGVRRVCMLRKLSGVKDCCSNLDLIIHFNPTLDWLREVDNHSCSHRYLVERKFEILAQRIMCQLEDCELLTCEIVRIPVGVPGGIGSKAGPEPINQFAARVGDVWSLTATAIQLIVDEKTDEAIDNAVRFRLRKLDPDEFM